MATDRLFNQTQGDSLLSILAQIRDGYNSVDGAFYLSSENPIQNKKITGAVTDTIETLGGTAQKSYAIGQYFLANDGYYYVATGAITAGSSNISSSTGGNCSKTCITAAMNNLSSQISNLSTNTAYSETTNKNDFDLSSGVTIVSGGVTARKHGNCVWIYLIVQKTLTLNTWHNLFTVPSGYYPPGETIMFSAINDTTSLAISARLSNGVVSVYPVSGNSSAAAQNISINISIILKS